MSVFKIIFFNKTMRFFCFIVAFSFLHVSYAQNSGINWTKDGLAYLKFSEGDLIKVDPKTEQQTVLYKKECFIPAGETKPLNPDAFQLSDDNNKILLFVNTAKVWRYNTRGDYWLYDIVNKRLRQLGKNLPSQSLMFAKFSPDSRFVAFVSERNIFSEDVSSGIIKKLTTDGTRKLINGTFDWVYEEEFGCRDGFRWSPDSRNIAYWQVDATKTRDYYMLNTTDSAYSKVIPVEYPKVGQTPSSVRIGVVALSNGMNRWMKIEGDPKQHYLTRMEWVNDDELIVQQLNRKQQESKLIYCNINDGSTKTFWAESDEAWVDMNTDNPVGWNWVNNKQDFIWISEKDGWRHLYKISKDGKTTTLLTKGNYDIDKLLGIDEVNNFIYFSASPNNPTQLYLYRVQINSFAKSNKDDAPEAIAMLGLNGTHAFYLSPNCKIARHFFSNHNTPNVQEWISLPDSKPLSVDKSIPKQIKTNTTEKVDYFTITTIDGVTLDAWMHFPKSFDPAKKYPLVVYVYGEPATTTVADVFGNHDNFLYDRNMSEDGYIQLALDNRGTPALKGAAWRKSIYRRNGQINIRDMAMGVKKILEYSYIDKDRIAVWGWSGGGSSTLHLLFRFPELFKVGIAIAPVSNLLSYDNIYTERYMGLPQENMDDYLKGSAINYASELKGKLLLIHGSGDDNVHYSNAESLVNELVKHNKQFQFMPYPNRTHSISEGEGTSNHLSTLYSEFLRANCLPGAK
jgi:dipeptidyl-peptidase-4